MTSVELASPTVAEKRSARDWVQVLAHYREPSTWRSVFELLATLVPFVMLWVLAWLSLSVNYWLAFGLGLGGVGLWMGQSIGITTASVLFVGRFFWLLRNR